MPMRNPDAPRFNPDNLTPAQRQGMVPVNYQPTPNVTGQPRITYFVPQNSISNVNRPPAPAPMPRAAAPAPVPPARTSAPAPRPAPSAAPAPRPAPRPVAAPPPSGGGGGTPATGGLGGAPAPTPTPPQWYPAVPRDWNMNPEAVRATGGNFDPNFLQNLALFSAQNLMRPQGHLSFDPVAANAGHGGLDQFGQPVGAGNAPLMGMPQTLLGDAIARHFMPAQGHWGPGNMPPAQQAAQGGQTPGQTGGAAPPPGSLNHPAPAPAAPPMPRPVPAPQSAGGIQPPARSVSPTPAPQTNATYHQPTINQYYQPPAPNYQPPQRTPLPTGRARLSL